MDIKQLNESLEIVLNELNTDTIKRTAYGRRKRFRDAEKDFNESLNEEILADGSEYRTMKEVTEENGDILWAVNKTR